MILCVEIRIDVFFSILMLSAQRFKGYELALICRHQDIVCGRSQRQGLESDKVVISRMSDIHMLTPYSSRGTRALAFAVCSLVFDVTCGATPDRRPIQRGSSPTWLFSHSSFFLLPRTRVVQSNAPRNSEQSDGHALCAGSWEGVVLIVGVSMSMSIRSTCGRTVNVVRFSSVPIVANTCRRKNRYSIQSNVVRFSGVL